MIFMDDFNDLVSYKNKIYDKFLAQYFPADPNHTPDIYIYDVSAFILHFHAAIEDYVERLASKSVSIAITNWTKENKFSRILLSLSVNKCEPIIVDANSKRDKRIQNLIDSEIIKQVHLFQKSLDGNHGVGPRYLEKILAPIGIDIFVDIGLENSLMKIADYRGEFAHKRVSKPLAPEDAISFAEDCIKYFEQLSKNADLALSI